MKNFINSLHNDQSVMFSTSFCGLEIPDMRRPWEVGCAITVPSDYQPCFQEMPSGISMPFIPVELVFRDGERQIDKLFLNTLTKTIRTNGVFVRTHGTVVDRIREFSNWDEAIKYGLAGRTFVISSIRTYEVVHPVTGNSRLSKIFGFDFV